MAKVQGKIENGKLLLELPLFPSPIPSQSGKSVHIAGTDNKFVEVEVEVNGKKVRVKVFAVLW